MKLLLSFACGLAVLAVLFALSWNDVLPGSWRLQGWVLGIEGRDNRERLQHAAERLAGFRSERDSVESGAIVFLGSSTIEQFPLEQVFPGKPCVNRGINGDAIADLRTRLNDSLPAAQPAGLVIAIGGNDLRRLGHSGKRTAADAVQFMDELRERYPDVPILWLGLFGESQAPADELAQSQQYNALVQKSAADRGIAFLATQRDGLIDPDGRLLISHAADRYHLNLTGYLLLGQWITDNGGGVGVLLRP